MNSKAFKVLTDEMEAFLRVPKVSYDEWAGLDLDSKAALLTAAKKIELERILALIAALRSGDGAERLSAELDGGDVWVETCVSKALDDYAARRKNEIVRGNK